MKLEGWIAIINNGWIGSDDKKELMLLTRGYGTDWPIFKIKITVQTEAKAITIPDSEEAQDG